MTLKRKLQFGLLILVGILNYKLNSKEGLFNVIVQGLYYLVVVYFILRELSILK